MIMVQQKLLLLLVALVVNCDSKPEAYGEYSFNRPNLPFFTSYKNLSPSIPIQSGPQQPAINAITDESKANPNVPCDNNESHKPIQFPTVVIIYPEVEKISKLPCENKSITTLPTEVPEPCPTKKVTTTIQPTPTTKAPEPCLTKELTTTTQPTPTTKAPEPCLTKELTTTTQPTPTTKAPEPCPPKEITRPSPPPLPSKAPKPYPPKEITTTTPQPLPPTKALKPYLPKEVKPTVPPTSTSQSPKPCPLLLPKGLISTLSPLKITTRIPLPPPTKAPEPCPTQPPQKVTTRIPLPPPTKAPEPCSTQPPQKVTTRIPLPPPTKAPEPCPTQPPQKVTTRIPLPPPTKVPEPCPSQPPQKVTTRIPLPPPTKVPEPCITQPPQKVTTKIPLPPPTKAPEPCPTQPPQKVTTRIPLPPPTKAPEPCPTQPPQKVTTRIPLPPATKAPEPCPTQVLVKAQEIYQPAIPRSVTQSKEFSKPVSSLKSTSATSHPALSIIPSVRQVPVEDSVPINCVNGEIYAADAANCDQYIMCYFGKALLMDCPAGLAFNRETNSCDWAENVPTCNPRAFTGFTCPKEIYNDHIDNYRYGESCRQYIACHKGMPRLLRCDDGSFFHDDLKACVDAENVTNCKDILY